MQQRKYNPSQPLLFIHLPKCAGASLRRALPEWFGNKFYAHYYNEKDGTPPIRHTLLQGSCVYGHFNRARGIGAEEYYPEVTQRVTIIRNPLEVAISNYFYGKKRRKNKSAYRDGKYQPVSRVNLDNTIKNEESFLLQYFPKEIDTENYKDVLDEYFLFIGAVECIDDSLSQLASLLGKEKLTIPYINESPRDEELANHAIRDFRERNDLAFRVWKYAIDRVQNTDSWQA